MACSKALRKFQLKSGAYIILLILFFAGCSSVSLKSENDALKKELALLKRKQLILENKIRIRAAVDRSWQRWDLGSSVEGKIIGLLKTDSGFRVRISVGREDNVGVKWPFLIARIEEYPALGVAIVEEVEDSSSICIVLPDSRPLREDGKPYVIKMYDSVSTRYHGVLDFPVGKDLHEDN
ncbi:hypothetical protein ACFL4W_01860 [Planctomycetota bacterium]